MEPKEQQENLLVQSKQDTASKKQSEVTHKIQSSIQKFCTRYNIKISNLILYLLIILAVIILLIIILSRKKPSKSNINKKIVRSTDGFADSTYMEKVTKELAAKNWGVQEIAKELELPVEEVQNIIDTEKI